MTVPAWPGPAGGEKPARRASFAQERLWFIEALDPGNALYNQLICFRIRGALDARLLERSLEEVVCRHEALRTNLSVTDGQVYQSVSSPAPLDVKLVDLSDQPCNSPLEEAGRRLKEDARKPFDLASEPLVRPRLFKLAPGDHLLGLITHHTIMDGWSMGIVVKELAAIYDCISAGLPPAEALPDPGLRYTDYADLQRRAFEAGEFDDQLRYWLNRLGGDLPILQLPLDHPRPAMQTYDGKVYTLVLPPDMTKSLKAIARREKATLFMALLSAFFALVHRYSGQDDVIVGCPIAGRNQLDAEGMVGLCVNTLALRCTVSREQPFLELLRQVRTATLEAYENQDLPFEKLVEKLTVERSLDTSPVFQTLFQLRNFPAGAATIGGCTIGRHEFEEVMVKADLTLEVTETEAGLSCRFEYPVALFDRATIIRMAEHWQTMLEDIIADPSKDISSLRLLSDEDSDALQAMWKGCDRDYPKQGIPGIFEDRAREYPGRIAVRYGGESITYHQLNDRANHLARQIKAGGIRPGDPVVLLMERSPGMIVAMIAVLKAGGAYVPVSPEDPDSRIAGMLEDLRPQLAIADPEPSLRMTGRVPGVLVIDDSAAKVEYPENPEACTGPDSLAYIMFTSGSTGKPKGVCIPHRGIARLIVNTDYVKISPGDKVAHLSDPAFDASTFEIWGALLNGGTIIILDKDAALSPAELKQQIEGGIDVLFMTTPLFHAIAGEDPAAFKGIRDLLVGGDVLRPELAAAVLRNSAPRRLLNAYGPTENTTFSTWYHLKEELNTGEQVPIGRPIANSSAYVLDSKCQLVPAGITGEIYLAGDGLASGYLARPDLTAARFLPDPFKPGHTMYRTGDLGRYLPDGNLQFTGRADGQVKIRGFRVETGEVAAALKAHGSVREAVVTTYTGPGVGKALAAHLVPAAGATLPTTEEIRQYLAEKLPPYMIPSSIAWIDTVPLTASGKIDYSALPAPAIKPVDQETPGLRREEPADPRLTATLAIWREVLGLPDVGPDDDFFSLGGHSLLAIILIGRMEKAFKVRLPISTIFKAPTARLMTQAVASQSDSHDSHVLVTLRQGGDQPPLYCIHGVGGTLFEFGHIVQQIDDRPVHGLQSPGLDGRTQPLQSVKEMAAEYIQEIRHTQPHGPYHLIAYCAGGAIAYEMACQLEEAGEKAGVLGIIDYKAPQQDMTSLAWSGYRFLMDNMGGASLHLSTFLHASLKGKVDSLIGLPGFLVKKLLRTPGEVIHQPVSPPTMQVSQYPDWIECMSDPQRKVARQNYDAISSYLPGRYGGKLDLFMSTANTSAQKRAGKYERTFGWKKIVAGGVDVRNIRGDHGTIMSPENSAYITSVIVGKMNGHARPGEGHGK